VRIIHVNWGLLVVTSTMVWRHNVTSAATKRMSLQQLSEAVNTVSFTQWSRSEDYSRPADQPQQNFRHQTGSWSAVLHITCPCISWSQTSRRPTSATNRQSSDRYGGARPCRALYVRTASKAKIMSFELSSKTCGCPRAMRSTLRDQRVKTENHACNLVCKHGKAWCWPETGTRSAGSDRPNGIRQVLRRVAMRDRVH